MTGRRERLRREEDDTIVREEVISSPDPIPVREAAPRRKRDDDIAPGTLLGGHYRVVRKLGAGAIGHVYEAINTWTTRRVALKLLRAELVDDPDIAKRFLIEAQAATRVAHPHIVDILDMGKDEATGHQYIVQEFLEGRDLHEHLKQRGRLTVSESQQVLIPVMQAVAAAHDKGVLHRDLKPENVFLVQSPDGHMVPKVIDFGLARTDSTAGNRMTRTGAVIGTPFYMSPEQARGESGLDARADVWALGVIWYEVLSGELPFAGDNLHAVLHAIFMSSPQRLDERVPDVSRELADVVHRAFTRDLAVRWATVNAFLDALLMVLPDEPPPPSLRNSRPGRISGPVPLSATFSPIPTVANTAPNEHSVSIVTPMVAQTQVVVSSPDDARRIRSLYAVLALALSALVVVSIIAISLMKREEATTPALAPPAVRRVVFAAHDASLDATAATTSDAAAVTDDASHDAGALADDAPGTADEADAGAPTERRHGRHRRHEVTADTADAGTSRHHRRHHR